jgi:hypothetical protein
MTQADAFSDNLIPSSPLIPNDSAGTEDALVDPVPQLNSLLRGEISAAETYRMAIDKLTSASQLPQISEVLAEIQREHGLAAQEIRARIRELGGEATDSSGAWGAWAKAVQGAMNLLGQNSSLTALKEGEEHGLRDSQSAIPSLDSASRQLVQNKLIPAQQKHINLLDQLIDSVAQA